MAPGFTTHRYRCCTCTIDTITPVHRTYVFAPFAKFHAKYWGGGGAKNTNLNVFGEYGWGVTSQVPRSSYSNVCALILLYTANNLAHICAMKSDSQCG